MSRSFAVFTSLVFVLVVSSPAQVLLDDGTTVTIMNRPLALGPPQPDAAVTATGLPFFTLGLKSFDTTLPITFIGADPTVPGTGTTTVPTLIVPLLVNFLDGSGSLDATGIVANTLESPVFTPVDFNVGGTDVGVTQYPDAVQRAEFWTYANPAGVSPGYHVLLQPIILPTITINVPAASGHISHTVVGNIPLGRVNIAF
jgi:hypothetical protein